MSHTIDCTNRVVTGHAVRKLRKEGIMPAVIYGDKTESQLIQTDLNAFVKVAKVVGKSQPITINLDGKKLTVKIQQADLHPVKGTFRHVDFILTK
jgi:large subunit ribosomal protein L25